ncbi:MAG: winged helix-turn-helix transcriptional regulator [Bacilli bacterium]|nr:winged helix-turn-helix transcriptional regulator [Bacilli bacterium]
MYQKYSVLFRALSDPNRIKILELLIQGETCGCTLIDNLSISQPTLSYHLKQLSDAGLVKSVKEGTWNHHYVQKEVLAEIIQFLSTMKDIEVIKCNL